MFLCMNFVFKDDFCCRLLDNLKMPARTSGFHICDILDLNDAAAGGKQNAGGEAASEQHHQLHHTGELAFCLLIDNHKVPGLI